MTYFVLDHSHWGFFQQFLKLTISLFFFFPQWFQQLQIYPSDASFRRRQSWMSPVVLPLLLLRKLQDGPAALWSGRHQPSAWEAGQALRAGAGQRKPHLRGIPGAGRRTQRHVSLGAFVEQTLGPGFWLSCASLCLQHCQAGCRAAEAPPVRGAARIRRHGLVEGGRQGPLHQGETAAWAPVHACTQVDKAKQSLWYIQKNKAGLIIKLTFLLFPIC